MLTRTVKRYTEMKAALISGVCRLLGISRQKYYRGVWGETKSRERATRTVTMVMGIRERMPRIGTRKLHHKLGRELKGMGVGRDRLFDILRANHMLITPYRSYHVPTRTIASASTRTLSLVWRLCVRSRSGCRTSHTSAAAAPTCTCHSSPTHIPRR